MIANRLLFLLFLHSICLVTFSQKQHIKFEHIGTSMGLSQSNVICIFQDSRGFMWFGTRDGLNKYDGYKFTVYKYDEEGKNCLSQNTVQDIAEDSDGNLWIGTWGGGLDHFNWQTEKFTSYKTDKTNPYAIGSNHINSLLNDSEGTLWVGTEESGLEMYDKKTDMFVSYIANKEDQNSLGDDRVKDIVEDSQHNLWIGTGNGLDFFNKKTKTFRHFKNNPKNNKSLCNNNILNICIDSKNQLWIGTRGGLDLFNKEKEEFIHFRSNPLDRNTLRSNVVRFLTEDDKGHLWIGTENGGLALLDIRTKSIDNYVKDEVDNMSLSHNSVWSFCKDKKGNMWVGTFSTGIDFVNSDTYKFIHRRHTASPLSLSSNDVLAIFEDSKKNLWIGTDGGGLNLFDHDNGTFKHFKKDPTNKKSLGGDYVLSIIEDSYGDIWIGTWDEGITVFNKEKNTFKHYKYNPADPKGLSSPNIWAMFEDSDKNIWIGTYSEGINLYDRKNDNFINYRHTADPQSLNRNTINTFFEDKKGNLWIGTYGGGLELFDKKTGSFTHFSKDQTKNSIGNNDIFSIAEDKEGNLWIGTNVGLNRMDGKTGQFTSYYMKDGLPNNAIAGLLFDDNGNLWISTFNGLSCFNPITKKFKNFGINDGLQSNEFKMNSCFKSNMGKMYFGGINGFNEFDPDSIRGERFEPPLVLTDFQILNKSVLISTDKKDNSPLKKSITVTKELVLDYSQSAISFQFASLNYTVQEKKQYSYKLEGFDKNWNNVGTVHSATYTNLDPGTYTFKVRGLNNEGNWSSNTTDIELTIIPPFWLTWWFKMGIGLSIVGSAFAFYRFRINIVKGQKRKLQLQVEERTAMLVQSTEEERKSRKEAEKARLEAEQATRSKSIFLATMSHEIRTPMNGVIGMSALLAETGLTDQQREYTNTITSCGESLLTVINDILDFSKIESDNLELEKEDFNLRVCIEDILDIFTTKAGQIGLDLIYHIDHNVPLQIVGDGLRLRQILTNLVGNAVKFTEKGEVFVGVHLLNPEANGQVKLEFEIRDTGLGIPQDKLGRLFKSFSQVDSSTTRKYGGTGLGLVISEKLVQLMGGQIKVKSEPGHGSTFSFTILTQIGTKVFPSYTYYNMSDHAGKKILVVDDNMTSRMILKTHLESWNLVPTLASSGEEASGILSDNHLFDLVLTDMQMPVMNGICLARSIKDQYPDIPIVLLSSGSDDSVKNNQHIFSSILIKPIKKHVLNKQILNALEKKKSFIENKPVQEKLSENFSETYPLKILVAEDNGINQQLILHVLNKLGYKPNLAENGLDVIDAFRQQFYDLILMDMQMPEMDGLEATRIIRKQITKQPVIIALTANAMQGDQEECLDAGMNDYLSKPLKLEQLVDMLKKWAPHNN